MGSSEQNESLPPPNPLQVSLAAEIRLLTGLRGKVTAFWRAEKRHKMSNFVNELGRGRGCWLNQVHRDKKGWQSRLESLQNDFFRKPFSRTMHFRAVLAVITPVISKVVCTVTIPWEAPI